MVSFEIISIIFFFVIVAILAYRDRKNIEFKYVLLIKRSQKGKNLIHKFADKYREQLKIFGNIAIIVAVIASIYGMWLLINSTINLFLKPAEVVQPIKLIFPSVKGVKLPEFILGVPFWYWIIGVFFVMFSHEPMHAFLMRAEKIKIKSFGVLLLLILPGAFVEPDDRQLKKASAIRKLRIYAAGSFGNFILAGIILLLMLGYNQILNYALVPQGVIFDKTIGGSGAEAAGLQGMITEVNSVQVKNINNFANAIKNIKPGDLVKIKTTVGEFEVKTTEHAEDKTRAFIGIENPQTYYIYGNIFSNFGYVSKRTLSILDWFSGLTSWSFILNLGVGLFNLFPLKPLDGGLIFEEIVKYFYKGKNAEFLVNTVSVFVLGLVLINLFGPNIIRIFRLA